MKQYVSIQFKIQGTLSVREGHKLSLMQQDMMKDPEFPTISARMASLLEERKQKR